MMTAATIKTAFFERNISSPSILPDINHIYLAGTRLFSNSMELFITESRKIEQARQT
jgi:hypothetical protein